jgi:hypothetical protein
MFRIFKYLREIIDLLRAIRTQTLVPIFTPVVTRTKKVGDPAMKFSFKLAKPEALDLTRGLLTVQMNAQDVVIEYEIPASIFADGDPAMFTHPDFDGLPEETAVHAELRWQDDAAQINTSDVATLDFMLSDTTPPDNPGFSVVIEE